jgi:O-antigen/teichoic acid export membrane protein
MEINEEVNRSRRMTINILFSFVIKGGSVLVGVLAIPAYMNYFSNDIILGIWYTLLSLLSWVLNFDLGIGNGMRNMLVPAIVSHDDKQIKRLISSAYIAIGIVSVVFACFGGVIIKILNWQKVFNVDTSIISAGVLQKSVMIVLIGIIGQFFFKLITSILNSMEKTAISSVLPLLSNIIILIYVLLNNNRNEEAKLIGLSWIYMLAVNIPYIIVTIIIFLGPLHKSRPTPISFDSKIAKKVLTLGMRFFGIQIAMMVVTVTNEILIAILFGADKVVEYQVYNKVFYTVATLFALITNPVWSAITTAYYQRQMDWIKNTYKRLWILVGLASIGTFLLALILQPIVNIWLGDSAIIVDWKIATSFALYAIVIMMVYAESSIANGMSKLKPQMFCYIGAAIVKIPLCIILAKLLGRWDMIVLANAICMFPYVIIQHIVSKNILQAKRI